jgi:periplasmic divalent cation tolerance protein
MPEHHRTEDHLLVYCTCPDEATAQRLATALVDDGLAACVNILPGVQSVYCWQGKRESAQEHLLIIKTLRAAYPQLENTVVRLHPYELPEVIAVPITQGLKGYLAWIDENVSIRNDENR